MPAVVKQPMPLGRLLQPQSIAVVGGEAAAEVLRQCRRIGFTGPIWPVNARRTHMEGVDCFASVEALPAAPDVAFVAVPREETVKVVRSLARRGAGGAICYASGFAEVDAQGAALQRELVAAAGAMPLLGPNCYGVINYLDGCALWPDHVGGGRVARGVAILTQSGNIALNLTMQRHHLPIAYMMAIGNKAVSDIHDCMAALLDDPRVSAIGLHLEGLTDVAAFSRVAQAALQRGVGIVVLKAGSSAMGAALTASHTSSLAGADVLYCALFRQLGVARVDDLAAFLEALKVLHACGPLGGVRVGSLSCSGGDAALVADLGHVQGLEFPPLPPAVAADLAQTLGPLVPLHNPLDYQTYIWGNEAALTDCFAAMMRSPIDVCLLVLDFPHTDDSAAAGWDEVINAFLAAHARSRVPAILVSSLAELMPARAAARLLAAGIAPLQGLREAAVAIAAAASIGRRFAQRDTVRALAPLVAQLSGDAVLLDERAAKQALAHYGVRIPANADAHDAASAVAAAEVIGFPVVVKALSGDLAHKTEMGAVKLNLATAAAVTTAVESLQPRFGRFLVEKMLGNTLAELIVGVTRDPQFGLAVTVGAGGILVELLADSATLLLPATRGEVEAALRGLRCFVLLDGYRGRPPACIATVVDAIMAICAFAQANAGRLLELDVNPLIVDSEQATAADALVRLVGPAATGRQCDGRDAGVAVDDDAR
jgi:acetyl-CoA synthetase